MGQYITGILTGISITDIIDIVIVTVIVYNLLGFLTSSRAAQLAKGIIIVIAIAFLADLMGHESIETTRIYLRRTANEQQKIVDKVVNW